MSNMIWMGIAVVALTATVATGTKFYADQSLEAYYQQPLIQGSNYSLRYSNFEMGAVKGHANWSLTYQPNPCLSDRQYVFKGQDKIKRTWYGYQVESNAHLEKHQNEYVRLMQQPLRAKTTVNWAGGIKTRLMLPEMKIVENGAQLQLSAMNIDVDTHITHRISEIKRFEISIPNITIRDDNKQVNFNKILITTDQGLNQTVLKEGNVQLLVDHIDLVMMNRDEASIQFKQFDFKTSTILKDQTVDLLTAMKMGSIQVGSGPEYKKLVFDFDFKGLNRAKFQLFHQLTQQQNNSCAALQTYEKDAMKALLAILNAGFEFESLHNQMTTPSGELTVNWTGRIMPNYIHSPESLVQMLPSVIDSKFNIEFDKQMINALVNFTGRQDVNLQQIDEMLKILEQQGKLKLNGDMVKMSMEYKFGQPNFLTPTS